jgi:hypothetical protein
LLRDEVNLAEDAVLERLNSVLDADHCALLLTEKPTSSSVVGYALWIGECLSLTAAVVMSSFTSVASFVRMGSNWA